MRDGPHFSIVSLMRVLLFLSWMPIFWSPPSQANPWHLATPSLEYDTKDASVGVVHLRAGYLEEASGVPFKGNILYLEGFSDSMMNHQSLFTALTKQGYRVIAFDYMGQGGSDGEMNDSLVLDRKRPGLEIRTQAKIVWEKFARPDHSKKYVIGWSTGGLVAYLLAANQWADAVVMIAPGINPRLIVGDFGQVSESNLSCVSYPAGENPHVDPAKPENTFGVPQFGWNFLYAKEKAQSWKINSKVKGLLLLGGEDQYVDSAQVRKTVTAGAPHFEIVEYPETCHEIHNAQPEVVKDLQSRIIEFFNKAGS